jgi:hypothetical protein
MFTGQRPMMDETLNTGYEQNPNNCSGDNEGHIHINTHRHLGALQNEFFLFN